jgi:hypothetical protein
MSRRIGWMMTLQLSLRSRRSNPLKRGSKPAASGLPALRFAPGSQ